MLETRMTSKALTPRLVSSIDKRLDRLRREKAVKQREREKFAHGIAEAERKANKEDLFPYKGPDHSTEHAAIQLANRIECYWKAKGYAGIKAWVTNVIASNQRTRFFNVRTNIGPNGFPPK